jgi:hypothetical protein
MSFSDKEEEVTKKSPRSDKRPSKTPSRPSSPTSSAKGKVHSETQDKRVNPKKVYDKIRGILSPEEFQLFVQSNLIQYHRDLSRETNTLFRIYTQVIGELTSKSLSFREAKRKLRTLLNSKTNGAEVYKLLLLLITETLNTASVTDSPSNHE